MFRFRPFLLGSAKSLRSSRYQGLLLSIFALAVLGAFLSRGWFLNPSHVPANPSEEQGERNGVEAMQWLLAQSHYPYGTTLPYEVTQALHDDWVQLPDETTYQPPNGNSSSKLVHQWEFVGPNGLPVRSTTRTHSGRVRSLEWRSSTGLRVGSASGGLWESQSGSYVCLTDNVSPFIGAFATDPGNDNRIVIGTGEPAIFTGSGIYYTTDRGSSWTSASIAGTSPRWFYDLEFAPWNPLEVHAASSYRPSHFPLMAE